MPIRCSESVEGCDTCEHVCRIGCFGDHDTLLILDATAREPRAASEILEATGIPRTTLYRRIEQLVDEGFLDERMQLGPSGHHHKTYLSRIDGFEMRTTDEGLAVEIRYKDGSTIGRLLDP